MKKLVFASLLPLLLSVATPAMAAEITPQDLIFQGYQGRLASEGIPGYAPFLQGVYLGKIDAETIVKSAVSQGKLDPDLAQDETYLRQVKSALFSLRANGSGR